MEFHVIGTAEDGTAIDEVMDGQSRFVLEKHLKEMGVELKSIHEIKPPKSEAAGKASSVKPGDGLLMIWCLLGGFFVALAILCAVAATQQLAALLWGIFFLIAGFGFWIMATIRAVGIALVEIGRKQK